MNDHLSIGEILAHISTPKPTTKSSSNQSSNQSSKSSSSPAKPSQSGAAPEPRSRHPKKPVSAAAIPKQSQDESPSHAQSRPQAVGGAAPSNGSDEPPKAPEQEQEQEERRSQRAAGHAENTHASSGPDPQAAVLMQIERVAMPSIALANRMADEFDTQMERAQTELKYARQRANLAWSAVAFMALALLYLGWWTGGSIEGSRATATQATDAVMIERQRSAALAVELFQLRQAAQQAQAQERERSHELVAKLEAAHQSTVELAQRAADAERRLAQATATLTALQARLPSAQSQSQSTRSTAPSLPLTPLARPAETPSESSSVHRANPTMPHALRLLVEPGEP